MRNIEEVLRRRKRLLVAIIQRSTERLAELTVAAGNHEQAARLRWFSEQLVARFWRT
jgi:hypothetical protein